MNVRVSNYALQTSAWANSCHTRCTRVRRVGLTRFFAKSWVLGWILALAAQILGQQPEIIERGILSVGPAVTLTAKGGEGYSFAIPVPPGQHARVEVAHSSIDLLVSLFSPTGQLIVKLDGKEGRLWRERLSFVGKEAGSHRLEIRVYGTSNNIGNLSVQLAELRPETTSDQSRMTAEAHLSRGIEFYNEGPERRPDAVREFASAVDLWRELGETSWHAIALTHLGWTNSALGRDEAAYDAYSRAADLFQSVNDRSGLTMSLVGMGTYFRQVGQNERAVELFLKSLKIAREIKDWRRERVSHRNLALAYSRLRQPKKAFDHLNRELEVSKSAGDLVSEVEVLLLLGRAFQSRGDPTKANDYAERANARIGKSVDDKVRVLALLNLANHSLMAKQYDKALKQAEESLGLSRKAGLYSDEGESLSVLAYVSEQLGQLEQSKQNLEQRLGLARDKRDLAGECTAYVNLALFYGRREQFDLERGYYEQAIAFSATNKLRHCELSSLEYIGNSYIRRKEYERARELYEKLLALSEDTPPIRRAFLLQRLGLIANGLRHYDQVRDYIERSLALSRSAKNRLAEADNIKTLGVVYKNLGQYEKGRDYLQQSLAIFRHLNDRYGEANALSELSDAHTALSQHEKARDHLDKALSISRAIKSRTLEAFILDRLSAVNAATGGTEKALQFAQQSLAISREIKIAELEGSALRSIGDIYLNSGQYEKARENLAAASRIGRELQQPMIEGYALYSLMLLEQKAGNISTAVLYGKRGLNLIENVRGNIKTFDDELRQSFVKKIEPGYRALAAMLIAQGRLPEANAVLDLLKDEEYKQLTRSVPTGDVIPYSKSEKEVVSKIENLFKLEREAAELRKLGSLTPEQATKLESLRRDIVVANTAFDTAIDLLGKTEASVSSRVGEIKEDQGIQSALTALAKDMSSGVVALYTVLGTSDQVDRPAGGDGSTFGWVILVTERGYKAYPIDTVNLEETVFAFRSALSSPRHDPQVMAEKIYSAIFRQTSEKQKRTLEADLAEYLEPHKDKTIMWSLDGVLRYIPMSALHDGKKYLVESYRNIVFTKESFLWLTKDNRADWSALGLGVSEQRENFTPLPGVKTELETIIREPNKETGIMKGSIRLNETFKKQMFLNTVGNGSFPVVHIASHYGFNPVEQESSFLLVGDGRLTFRELKENKNLFSEVDLLTLSACDTGVSANGKEAEGFAYLAQSLGAKSVIASLWPVSDAGTPHLMINFYRLKARNPQMSKGEAFRQAQLALLSGSGNAAEISSSGTSQQAAPPNQDTLSGRQLTQEPSKAGATTNALIKNLRPFNKVPHAPYAHPYYWSSFVIIGNWK